MVFRLIFEVGAGVEVVGGEGGGGGGEGGTVIIFFCIFIPVVIEAKFN